MKTSNKILLSSIAAIFIALLATIIIHRANVGGSDVQALSKMLVDYNPSAKVIKGNGKIETKSFSPDPFENVSVRGWYKVIIKQGDKSNITITTDSNILSQLKTTVSEKTLTVQTPNTLRPKPSKIGTIVITNPSTTGIFLNGQTELEANDLKSDGNLTIHLSGNNKATLNAQFKFLDVTLAGNSTMNANLIGGFLNLKAGGQSQLNFKGNVEGIGFAVAGNSKVNAKDLHADTVGIVGAGQHKITVHANKSLEVGLLGHNSVTYYGKPSYLENRSQKSTKMIAK